MDNKHELHPLLQDASLEKVCEMANKLSKGYMNQDSWRSDSADLHYVLEYLRLNFDLVPKK
jgi:hypothetical protein